MLYTLQSATAVQRFDFGGSTYGPSPYVVSQLTGAYQSFPDFLDNKHSINTAADADAYLSRLRAFGDQLDANTERMHHDAGLGVVPPDFLLDTALIQLGKTRVPADQALVVTSLAKRAAAKGLSAHYARDAARIYDEKVLPALDRQIAAARGVTRCSPGCARRRKNGSAPNSTSRTSTTRCSPAGACRSISCSRWAMTG